MLFPNNPAAGVYSQENDLAQRISLITNGVATLVLPLPRGEVGENMVFTGTDEIDRRVGPSRGPYGRNVQILKILMGNASALNVTRVAVDEKFAGVVLTTFDNFCMFRPIPETGLTDPEEFQLLSADIGLFYSKSAYGDADEIFLTVEPDVNDIMGIKSIVKVYEGRNLVPTETWPVTTHYYKDESGNQFFIEDVINENSNLIGFRLNPTNAKLLEDEKNFVINAIAGGPFDPQDADAPNGQLRGGSDGMPIDIDHADEEIRLRSVQAVVKAWNGYRDWEDVHCGILCDGGLCDPIISNKIDEIAMIRQDCIATTGAPVFYQDRDDCVAYRRGKKLFHDNEFSLNSSWSTFTNSDVRARDLENARDFWVPASVCMTYTMLTSDQVASWLAPAGLNRGGLPFALGVRHRFRQSDRNILDQNQINPIAVFEGEGIFVFGADTLQAVESPLQDIGVRRLLSMLHASVRINSLPSVFEPNDSILRQNQVDSLEGILEPIRLGRGLDWYEVICDERNNPPSVEGNGDVVVDVFLDPTRYTKRIHLNAIVPKVGDIQYALETINRS